MHTCLPTTANTCTVFVNWLSLPPHKEALYTQKQVHPLPAKHQKRDSCPQNGFSVEGYGKHKHYYTYQRYTHTCKCINAHLYMYMYNLHVTRTHTHTHTHTQVDITQCTFSEGEIFMCPSVIVVKSYVSEGASSGASSHLSHSHSRHIPLERISLHGPAYAATHWLHYVWTTWVPATSCTTLYVHGMTLLRLAGVVLRMSSLLLLLLLLLSVGYTARVLLGLFRTTCTAPHDTDCSSLFSCSTLIYLCFWVGNQRRLSKAVNGTIITRFVRLCVRCSSLFWGGSFILELSAAALLVCCILDSPISHGSMFLNVGRESTMRVRTCEKVQKRESGLVIELPYGCGQLAPRATR